MDTAAEEHALDICQQLSELLGGPVTFVAFHNVLEDFADCQVFFAVLVPVDVPAVLRCFAQMIDVFFLLERQLFPSRNPVTHNFHVCKFIDEILEVLVC